MTSDGIQRWVRRTMEQPRRGFRFLYYLLVAIASWMLIGILYLTSNWH
jgi:hypothetical protein